jgi:GNAT superfamily N-acetyltransferase
MAARKHLNNVQFRFEDTPDEPFERYAINAYNKETNEHLGFMSWSGHPGSDAGMLQSIDVAPEHQRKGIATGMFNHARKLSDKNPSIHEIQHSNFRTLDGDDWAQSTGHYVPYNDMEETDLEEQRKEREQKNKRKARKK